MATNQKLDSLLDIKTGGTVTRKHITVDDKPYELRGFEELSIANQQRLAYCKKYMEEYFATPATVQSDAKAEQVFNEAIGVIVIGDFDSVIKTLSAFQKSQIVDAYMQANKDKLPAQDGAGGQQQA